MGCYPLKKMIYKAFGRCNGGEVNRRHSTRMVYTPPSTYSHTRVVKSVNFSSDNPVIIIPPDPNSASTIPKYYPEPVSSGIPKHHPEPDMSPPGGPGHASTSSSNTTRPENVEPKVPNRTRFGPGPDHPPADGVHPTPARREPARTYRGPVHGYVPSPLPRWEEGQRRREYFSGEYYYYPTPIREGIYNIATDPNRLTNMFSEENPNACTIV